MVFNVIKNESPRFKTDHWCKCAEPHRSMLQKRAVKFQDDAWHFMECNILQVWRSRAKQSAKSGKTRCFESILFGVQVFLLALLRFMYSQFKICVMNISWNGREASKSKQKNTRVKGQIKTGKTVILQKISIERILPTPENWTDTTLDEPKSACNTTKDHKPKQLVCVLYEKNAQMSPTPTTTDTAIVL